MSVSLSIDTEKVLASLRRLSLKGAKALTVNVVYETEYALFVHEDLEANHPNGGQAKFLEQPMRTLRHDMMEIVTSSIKNKNGLEEGLRRAGKLLLDTSRVLVPVDTGRLRDSGKVVITNLETGLQDTGEG